MSISACNANRHTGRLSATVDELARAMTRAPTAVAMNLDELEACAVCRVIRNSGSQLVLEIRDRFWPYEKQQTPGCAPEPEAEFVQKVRDLFLAPACVQASFSAADEKIATRPSSTRRFPGADLTSHPAGMCPQVCLHAQRRKPIADHQPEYFADVVEEVRASAIPESYWEPLRAKVTRMETTVAAGAMLQSHDAATRGAVFGCPTAPEHLPTSAECLPTSNGIAAHMKRNPTNMPQNSKETK